MGWIRLDADGYFQTPLWSLLSVSFKRLPRCAQGDSVSSATISLRFCNNLSFINGSITDNIRSSELTILNLLRIPAEGDEPVLWALDLYRRAWGFRTSTTYFSNRFPKLKQYTIHPTNQTAHDNTTCSWTCSSTERSWTFSWRIMMVVRSCLTLQFKVLDIKSSHLQLQIRIWELPPKSRLPKAFLSPFSRWPPPPLCSLKRDPTGSQQPRSRDSKSRVLITTPWNLLLGVETICCNFNLNKSTGNLFSWTINKFIVVGLTVTVCSSDRVHVSYHIKDFRTDRLPGTRWS